MNKPHEGFLSGLIPGNNFSTLSRPFDSQTVVFFDDSPTNDQAALAKRQQRLLEWTKRHSLPWEYGHIHPNVPVMDQQGEYVAVWTLDEYFRKARFGPTGEEYFQRMSLRLFLYRESLVEWLRRGNVNRLNSFMVMPECRDPDGVVIKDTHLLATFHG